MAIKEKQVASKATNITTGHKGGEIKPDITQWVDEHPGFVKCSNCGKVLFRKVKETTGIIEVRCRFCRKFVQIQLNT